MFVLVCDIVTIVFKYYTTRLRQWGTPETVSWGSKHIFPDRNKETFLKRADDSVVSTLGNRYLFCV